VRVILDALQRREEERRAIAVELDTLTRDGTAVACFQPHAVRRELAALLEEWQHLAAGEPDEARGVLSTVLRERIAFHPEGAESYKLTIPIAFDRVMRAVIPASNWNGVPNWDRRCWTSANQDGVPSTGPKLLVRTL
jgi:hypothetical protein